MQLKTIQTLRDNTYRVRFETTLSDAETELVSDFGEPTISMGGLFYGDSVSFEAAPSVGAVITQGAASGVYISSGLIYRSNANAFTVGAAGAYTITGAEDISYTITAATKLISTDFPYTNVFIDEKPARIYSEEISNRMSAAITTLRSKTDLFSSEIVETL